MNSRKRIISALNHIETERVPVDFGGTETTGIMGSAYNKLKKFLNISTNTQLYNLMLAKIEYTLTELIGSDTIHLLIEPKKWKRWKSQDGIVFEIPRKANLEELDDGSIALVDKDGETISRSPKNSEYFFSEKNPLRDIKTSKDIDLNKNLLEKNDWPNYCDEDFNDLNIKARKLYYETDKAIIGNFKIHLFAAAQTLRGMENFMIDLVANKKLAKYLLTKIVEAYLPRIDRYSEAVGPYVQAIHLKDDLGTQTDLQISPELYREMVKPFHKKLFQYIKEKSKKPLLLHSCGSIYELIPDLIEAGIDALNPIQVSAANMGNTRKLKKEFGKYITFWGGGCDTQKILPYGSVKDVRKEVRKRVGDLAPGGGFIFCPVHNIQADVPAENILAMYKEIGSLSE